MSSRGPKQAVFAEFAAVAKALGHPHRLELLEQLAQGEGSVELLAGKTGLSIANASQHLQQMLRAGLAANRREGKFVYTGLPTIPHSMHSPRSAGLLSAIAPR